MQIASRFSKLLLKDLRIRPRIKSIVTFGSVIRPRDFVDGLSDIDMLVIVDRKSKRVEDCIRRLASSTDQRISPAVFTRGGFFSKLEAGAPSALLMLKGRALHDMGPFSNARGLVFKPTERTVQVLLDHAFCALSIALDNYFSGMNLSESVNSAYHCARHALRAVIVKEAGVLVESNGQVLRHLRRYPKLRESFKKLVKARKTVDRLRRGYKRELARRPTTTLRDDMGRLLLSAEEVAVSSHKRCTGKRPSNLRELLNEARRKFGDCEITRIAWESPGWMLVVEHGGKLKHFTPDLHHR